MKPAEELLPILDAQIETLQAKLELMERMGQCVRQGDMERLGAFVEDEAALARRESQLEQQTQQMRARLARLTHSDAEQLTLGRLVEMVEGPLAIQLSDRRERLVLLVERLQEQATLTAMMVAQVLELNQRMLAALGGCSGSGSTYSPEGEVELHAALSTFRRSV